MTGMNDAKIIACTLEGIEQVVIVDAGQRIDGVEPMREQCGDGGLGGGQIHRRKPGFFVPLFPGFGFWLAHGGFRI